MRLTSMYGRRPKHLRVAHELSALCCLYDYKSLVPVLTYYAAVHKIGTPVTLARGTITPILAFLCVFVFYGNRQTNVRTSKSTRSVASNGHAQ